MLKKKQQNSLFFRKASRYFWAPVSLFKKSPLNFFNSGFNAHTQKIICTELFADIDQGAYKKGRRNANLAYWNVCDAH